MSMNAAPVQSLEALKFKESLSCQWERSRSASSSTDLIKVLNPFFVRGQSEVNHSLPISSPSKMPFWRLLNWRHLFFSSWGLRNRWGPCSVYTTLDSFGIVPRWFRPEFDLELHPRLMQRTRTNNSTLRVLQKDFFAVWMQQRCSFVYRAAQQVK